MSEPKYDSTIRAYIATVKKVYGTTTPIPTKDKEPDTLSLFNGDKGGSKKIEYYGCIEYAIQSTDKSDIAHPFDKNNFTFPIVDETVLIIKTQRQTFWLPYSRVLYPNYRRELSTFESTKFVDQTTGNKRSPSKETQSHTQTKKYEVKHKIKFLKPYDGDTFITGRVGNTIRFSEKFLVPQGGKPSPTIIMRTLQDPANDSKPTGELVEENFNKDGSSIYISSQDAKIPFIEINPYKDSIKNKTGYFKNKSGQNDLSNSWLNEKDLKGNNIFMQTDRILLAARSKEFLMFGARNMASFTGGKYSVDATNDVHIRAGKDAIYSCGPGKTVFINSDGGKVFVGKYRDGAVASAKRARAEIQHMVNGADLFEILSDMLREIMLITHPSPCGPTGVPNNVSQFANIVRKLPNLYSMNNFLSSK